MKLKIKEIILDFDIDGIVYKVNDFKLQQDLDLLQTHQDGP